eukprot:1175861-Prorocentrum_minimum.AAC.2
MGVTLVLHRCYAWVLHPCYISVTRGCYLASEGELDVPTRPLEGEGGGPPALLRARPAAKHAAELAPARPLGAKCGPPLRLGALCARLRERRQRRSIRRKTHQTRRPIRPKYPSWGVECILAVVGTGAPVKRGRVPAGAASVRFLRRGAVREVLLALYPHAIGSRYGRLLSTLTRLAPTTGVCSLPSRDWLPLRAYATIVTVTPRCDLSDSDALKACTNRRRGERIYL